MKPEPVAKLFQHNETGRLLIWEMDEPDFALASSWSFVSYLYNDSAFAETRRAALVKAAMVCDALGRGTSVYDGKRLAALADAAAAIRALIDREANDENPE